MRAFGPEGSREDQIDSGHVSEGKPVYYDTLEATRHVMAGFAATYAGLLPPYQHFDPLTKSLESNWLWAIGMSSSGLPKFSICLHIFCLLFLPP